MLQEILIEPKTQLNADVYIKSLQVNAPEYIWEHQSELLPDWEMPPQTIVFAFFECQLPLDGTNLAEEQLEKDRLLTKFYNFGGSFYSACHQQKIIADVICPKDGFPLYSSKGTNIFNIPAIVTRHLPSFQKEANGCGLIHPDWGRAVYPGLLLSVAEEKQIKSIITEITSDSSRYK